MIGVVPTRGNDPATKTLLEAANLPADDIEDAGWMFSPARTDGSAIGCGGSESAAVDILSCSIAIVSPKSYPIPQQDDRARIFERAGLGGAIHVYLLKTSASPFFGGHGFARIEGAEAPVAALGARQDSSVARRGLPSW